MLRIVYVDSDGKENYNLFILDNENLIGTNKLSVGKNYYQYGNLSKTIDGEIDEWTKQMIEVISDELGEEW